jgi:spermidine/putrescine transport system permease protein
MKPARAFFSAWAILVILFMYVPILVVALFSFNSANFGSVWKGFTLHWYASLLSNEKVLSCLYNSLLLAVTSTTISTVVGSLLGLALARFTFKLKPAVELLMFVPVIVPDVVLAIGLVSFYSLIRSFTGLLDLGFGAMLLGHVTFQIPFIAIVVRARALKIGRFVEEAAVDLGATPFQALWYVILPLTAPGVVAGALLGFTLSLDDFVVSFFTSGPGSMTLPVFIYSSVKRGITPEINAVSTIMLAFSILLTLTSLRLQRGSDKH